MVCAICGQILNRTRADWDQKLSSSTIDVLVHFARHLSHLAHPVESKPTQKSRPTIAELEAILQQPDSDVTIDTDGTVRQASEPAAQLPEPESPALALVRKLITADSASFAPHFAELESLMLAQEKAHKGQVEQLTYARDFHFKAANRLQEEVEQLQREHVQVVQGLTEQVTVASGQIHQAERERDAWKSQVEATVQSRVEVEDQRDAARQALQGLIRVIDAYLYTMAPEPTLRQARDKAEKEGLGGGGTSGI